MTDSAENYTHRVLCYIGGKHSNDRLAALQNSRVYQVASKNYNIAIR